MRILITGARGQIGLALGARLHDHGTILAPDRAALDLAKVDAIAATLDRVAPDMIINAAANTRVDRAEDEPELTMRVNADAPGVIARWAAARNVPFIHFSTDYVFDGSGERPWREDDDAQPASIYGRSKLAGEYQIRAAGGCFLILRTSWVYAAYGDNFLRSVARQAREQRELRVVADQIGAPTSAALIADAVNAIVSGGSATLRVRCARARGIVHLAAAGETSRHGFAEAIVAGLKARGVALAVERIVPIRSEDYPARARRPRNSRLDTTRLHDVFGTRLPHWETALAVELDQVAAELRADRSAFCALG